MTGPVLPIPDDQDEARKDGWRGEGALRLYFLSGLGYHTRNLTAEGLIDGGE